MSQLRIGMYVTTPARRGVGRIVAHHQFLPAWIVKFPQDKKTPLAWYEDRLTEARR